MSKRPHPALIGAFVLAALAVALVAIVVLGSGGLLKEKATYVSYFEGSLSGLDVGAPVEFRGVKVGSVKDITLIYNCEDGTHRIPVYVELEPSRVCYTAEGEHGGNFTRMIEQGLRAQIQSQSMLTGKLKIMLVERPGTEARLVGADPGVQEIPTTLRTADEVVRTLEELPIVEIVNRLHEVVTSLAKLAGSERTAAALSSTGDVVEGLDTTLKSLDDILRDARPIVTNVAGAVPAMMASLTSSNEDIQRTMKQISETMEEIENMLSVRSSVRYETENAIRESAAAAESLRLLLEYLQQHPESLLRGKRANGDAWQ